MVMFLLGAAASAFLVHSRWGRPVEELQTAAIAGFALPIAGALIGGIGSGNVLIAFGADTGGVLADVLVHAWAIAGAGAGFGAAWGWVNWILADNTGLDASVVVDAHVSRPAPAGRPFGSPGSTLRRGGAPVDDIGSVGDQDASLVTGPMMPALASVSGEFTPRSGLTNIEFPF